MIQHPDAVHWLEPGLSDTDATHWLRFLTSPELGIHGPKIVIELAPLRESLRAIDQGGCEEEW